MAVTVSIITAVLDSPEIVRRHMLHYQAMPLPDNVEWIIADDKSTPPLCQVDYDLPRLTIVRHTRPGIWTQPAARNFAVKHARGEMLICTDIDHIISQELLTCVATTPYDVVRFRREAGVLDEYGHFTQDMDELRRWGYQGRGLHLAPHTNSFGIRRDLYIRLGGVSERNVKLGRHPNREEVPLRRRLAALAEAGEITICPDEARPMLYMFPNGKYCGHKDFNPMGRRGPDGPMVPLFHNLPRKTR